MLLVENSFTVVTYVKQSLFSLRLFPFTKDFYHLEEVVVYGNSNYITIAFTWHRVTQVARRNRRKKEEEGMGRAYLWTMGRMRMGISWTYYPLPIANINIVNVTNIVQNYIVSSNAKQSHQIDTVVSQNER